jgi:hypothetical protein
MPLLFWLLAGVAGVYGLLKLGQIPIRHKPLEPRMIKSLLHTLLVNGADCSVLLIKVRRDGRFIQFRNCIAPGSAPRIEFGFPRAPWSEGIYEQVAELLDSRGIVSERVPTGQTSGVSEFLVANFEHDIDSAQGVASALLSDVFAVIPERDCYGILEGDLTRGVAEWKARRAAARRMQR